MTRIYFVRHAEPVHEHEDDRTRPLTAEGIRDAELVLNTLKSKEIDEFFCSPYKRSLDTIKRTAEDYEKMIITDERLREREKGVNGNEHGMFQKRWADHSFHEEEGESIGMVQERCIQAVKEILNEHEEKNIVIGTHGTALCSIINYYIPEFGCDDFLRIIDWMPYVVEMDFEGQKFLELTEHAHIEKVFKGKARADKA